MKKLGDMWKNLSDEEKQPFAEKADEEKGDYAEKIKDYKPTAHDDDDDDDDSDDEPKKGKRKTKKKKDPNAPKKAMSAYLFFNQAYRSVIKKDFPDLKSPDIMKKLGEKWKTLSNDEKTEYDQLARNDKDRYNRENADYGGSSSKNKKPKKPPPKEDDDDEEEEDDDDDDNGQGGDDGGDDDEDDDDDDDDDD